MLVCADGLTVILAGQSHFHHLLKGELLLDSPIVDQSLKGIQVDPAVLLPVDIVETEFGYPALQGHLTSFKPYLLGIPRPGLGSFVATGSRTAFAGTLSAPHGLTSFVDRTYCRF